MASNMRPAVAERQCHTMRRPFRLTATSIKYWLDDFIGWAPPAPSLNNSTEHLPLLTDFLFHTISRTLKPTANVEMQAGHTSERPGAEALHGFTQAIALQVKPVGMTMSPRDFRATHLILALGRILYCVRYRHRPNRSICPGNPSPIRSVSSTFASIIAAGRLAAMA
jgi:hypothetical protein